MADFLIVDDDTSVGLTFERMLREVGHRARRVESADQALLSLDRECPDAVILDIRMPAMDGMDFLRRLRSDPRLAGLPVGIVTGDYFLKDEVLAELAALHVEVRYKPMWMDDFQALAATLLASNRSPARHPS
jgi:CheY-like chemotaxis protein